MGPNAIAANGTRSADQLADWIERNMRMSHVYQPGVLRALLDAGGVATVRQIAQSLLAADEAQLRWYEQRAKTMPLKVLRKHGIVTMEGDLVRPM
jgi:DNA-binding transcriptional ArsR family regulator